MSDNTKKKRKFMEKEIQEDILMKVKLSKQRMDTVNPSNQLEKTETQTEEITTTPKRKATKANLERKREKTRLKKLRKRQQKRGDFLKADPKTQESALNYLKLWKCDRDNWKFMKIRQIWLLKNMYKSIFVSDDDFETLLFYIDSIKGHAREETLENAEKIVKDLDKKWNETDTKEEYDINLYDRARKVVQLL